MHPRNTLLVVLFSSLLFACGGAFTAAPQDPAEDGGSDPEAGSADPSEGHAPPGAHADGGSGSTAPGDGASACTSPSTPILGTPQAPIGGLSFEVAHAMTLTSFDFSGSGVQDTVELVDSANPCEPLASVSIPAHLSSAYAPMTENVSWPLQAGKTYYLVSVSGQVAFYNGPNGNGVTFPWTSGDLTVHGSVATPGATNCYAVMNDSVWLAFTNMTFCP